MVEFSDMCVFFLFLLVFLLEGLGGRNISVLYYLHPTINSMIYARRLILEICFPFGVVDKWWVETCKRRPKTEFNHREKCLCKPGWSPEEAPTRNRYIFPY